MNKLLELKILPNRKFSSSLTAAAENCINAVTDDTRLTESVKKALSLAVDNIILHASSSREYDITLCISTEADRLHVDLHDTAVPMDISGTDEGMKISNTINSYKCSCNGRKGRCQYMTFALNNTFSPVEQENFSDETAVTGVQIKLRDSVPSDFAEITKAYYREMGFSYIKSCAYDQEEFTDFITKGNNHALTAETEDGMFAGFHMLAEWDHIPGVYEGCMAIINPDVRKCGAFSKLMEANNEYFEHTVTHGVQISCAVTYHDITQKTRLKYGFTPCGFAFNQFPQDSFCSTFRGNTTRQSEAYSCHVTDHSPREVYVPAEVTEVLDVIYKGENLPRTYHTENSDIQQNNTDYTDSISRGVFAPYIVIRSVGKDYQEIIKDIIHRLKKCEIDGCQLYLSTEQPGVTDVYEMLKKYGFRFTGLIPNTQYGDLMILDGLFNNIIDYDAVITTGPFTELKEMLKKFDPDYND